MFAAASAAAAAAAAAAANEHKPILAERFKTKFCQNFIKTGVCPYETRCMFAHGDDDLRSKEMNLRDNLVTEEAIKNFQRAKWAAAKAAETPSSPKKKSAAATSPKAADAASKKSAHSAAVPSSRPLAPKLQMPLRRSDGPKAPQLPRVILVSENNEASPVDSDNETEHTSRTPDTLAAAKSPRPETPNTSATSPSSKAGTLIRKYRHDPYAPVAIGFRVLGDLREENLKKPIAAISPLAAAMLKQPAVYTSEPCYCADCCKCGAYYEGSVEFFAAPMCHSTESTLEQILLA